MKTRLGFTTARSEATPLTEDGSGVRVWGVPISTEWWCDQWANAEARYRLTSLCLGDESMARDGPGRFTGLAAAALEQVGRWESSGVLVRGRAWADVGGGDGYYALALRLCGASRVILLDPSPPSAWAAPVLASAGVNVLTTDARCFDYSEIDSIGFLYVPDVQVEELLQRSRRLEQLVTSEIDDADVVRETWKEHG